MDHFEKTIQAYVEKRSGEDALFAEKVQNSEKNIADCCTYILNWVEATKRKGFDNDEIYGQVVHYYMEDDIKVGSRPHAYHVVVDHAIELTPEEIEEAKQKAKQQEIDKIIAEEKKRLIKEANVELTEEEKKIAEEQARKAAIDKVIAEKQEKIIKKAAKAKPAPANDTQQSLF